jgi:hypothetical protein
MLVCAVGAGCGSSTKQTLDGRAPDQGIGEAVQPPDVRTEDSGWTGTENVGFSCDPSGDGKECTGRGVCLGVGGGVGVCTISGCTLEDVSTPIKDDNCPAIVRSDGKGTIQSICTQVPVAASDGGPSSKTFCLPQCRPDPEGNSCADLDPAKINTRLACDPMTFFLNDYSEVCLFPACTRDVDCDDKDPLHPQYSCDLKTGTCRVKGTPGVKVGSPCKTSTACGPGQFCYPEHKDKSDKVVAEGGYCTIVGCKFGGPWSCPEESKCFGLGSASVSVSFCLAVGCKASSPPESDGCRDEASAGQYACTVQDKDEVCWLDLKAP